MAAPEPAAPARVARRWWLVAATALAVVVAAVATADVVFPYGSINRDESTYVEFGDLIVDGRLTLDADEHRAFRPWASGIIGDRIVMKYAPPWPAVLGAFGLLGEGARRLAPAAAGAVVVVLVFLLARRLGSGAQGRGAAFAAVAAAASPLLVVQSATYLSYVFQLALGLGAAVLLLRRQARSAAAAGLVAGIAAFARPLDALLFVGPFAAIVLWRDRALVVPFLLGGMPAAAALLAYNAAVLGHPLRLPFTVTGRADAFGFGERGVFPNSTLTFDAIDGITATVETGGWLLAWSFGGPVLAVLAVLGHRRLAPSDAGRALALVTLLHPVAYLFFWGTHAVVHEWPGAATLGPFYHLPLLVPLAVFGGHGLAGIAPRRTLAAVTAAAVVVTAAWLPPKIRSNREVRDVYAAAARAVAAVEGPAIVLAPNRGVTGFDSWTPFLHNDPDLDQPVLYADERGPRDFHLVDHHPRRSLVRLVPQSTTTRPEAFRIEPVALRGRAPSLRLDVALSPPSGSTQVRPYLVVGRREFRQPTTPAAVVSWTVVAGDAARATPAIALVEQRGVLAVGQEVVAGDGNRRRYEQRIPFRVAEGEVELLVPGRGFRRLVHHWVAADVDRLVEVRAVAPDHGT